MGRKNKPKGKLLAGGEFRGQMKDGKADGQGIWTHPDGRQYIGEWFSDMTNGKGTLKWGDGRVYIGDFKEDKMHGKGKWTHPDGREYDGDWVNDMSHGQGTLKWADGRTYCGQWVENKMHGTGVWCHPDGRRYDGEWQNNKSHGQGVLTWKDGRRYKGGFVADKLNGKGVLYNAHGVIMQEGIWSEDKLVKPLLHESAPTSTENAHPVETASVTQTGTAPKTPTKTATLTPIETQTFQATQGTSYDSTSLDQAEKSTIQSSSDPDFQQVVEFLKKEVGLAAGEDQLFNELFPLGVRKKEDLKFLTEKLVRTKSGFVFVDKEKLCMLIRRMKEQNGPSLFTAASTPTVPDPGGGPPRAVLQNHTANVSMSAPKSGYSGNNRKYGTTTETGKAQISKEALQLGIQFTGTDMVQGNIGSGPGNVESLRQLNCKKGTIESGTFEAEETLQCGIELSPQSPSGIIADMLQQGDIGSGHPTASIKEAEYGNPDNMEIPTERESMQKGTKVAEASDEAMQQFGIKSTSRSPCGVSTGMVQIVSGSGTEMTAAALRHAVDAGELPVAKVDLKSILAGFSSPLNCKQFLLIHGANLLPSTQHMLPELVEHASVLTDSLLHDKRPPSNLTYDQAFALVMYTMDVRPLGGKLEQNFFLAINQCLKRRNPEEIKLLGCYLNHFLNALEVMKKAEEDVFYRGINQDTAKAVLDNYRTGLAVVWSGITSTTRNLKIALDFAGNGGVVFRVRAFSGIPLDIFNQFFEDEVLLAPNFRATVSRGPYEDEATPGVKLVDLAETLETVLVH